MFLSPHVNVLARSLTLISISSPPRRAVAVFYRSVLRRDDGKVFVTSAENARVNVLCRDRFETPAQRSRLCAFQLRDEGA